MIGTQELLLIVIVALVIFNWRKLPEMGSSIGKALTSFKSSLNEPEEIDLSAKKDSGETPPKT